MWEKKVYPLDKSKNKSKGARKQRHHAVSSSKLLVPDRCGTSSMRPHWSRLNYGSSSWMLNQLMNECDDGFDDYDNDDDMDYADTDVTDTAYVQHEVVQVETQLIQGQVYGPIVADSGGHDDDMGSVNHEVEENETDVLTGGLENEEQDAAEMMGFLYVEFERNVGSDEEDAWILIGD